MRAAFRLCQVGVLATAGCQSGSAKQDGAVDSADGDSGMFAVDDDSMAPPEVASCSRYTERDDEIDGVVDYTEEVVWHHTRASDEASWPVVEQHMWSIRGNTRDERSTYDDNLCRTFHELVETVDGLESGYRTTAECGPEGYRTDWVHEQLFGGEWAVNSTSTADYTFDDGGRVLETLTVTTPMAGGEEPQRIRAIYHWEGDVVVQVDNLIGTSEVDYYTVWYTYDEADRLLTYDLVLGDYFGSNAGRTYAWSSQSWDDAGNRLTYETGDINSNTDFYTWTYDELGRALSTTRTAWPQEIDFEVTYSWDPEVWRVDAWEHRDLIRSEASVDATVTYDGDFPWTQVTLGTPVEAGGLDFESRVTYTCPE